MQYSRKEKIKQSLLRVDQVLRDAADNFGIQEDEMVLAKLGFDLKFAESYLFLAAKRGTEECGRIVLNPAKTSCDGVMTQERIMACDICRSCGAKPGELHKKCCPEEKCPVCGGSIADCKCWIGMY